MIRPFQGKLPRVHPAAFLWPDAEVVGDVEIGEGSSLWPRVVVRGDVNFIRIGARTNLQDFAMVHVSKATWPTFVGDEVTVGHRATLHGCTVRDRCLVGMGAIVLDGAEIGEGSFVGAGALVTPGTKIPPGTMALGAPAKPVRPLRDGERTMIELSWRNYVELSARYRAEGLPESEIDRRAAEGDAS